MLTVRDTLSLNQQSRFDAAFESAHTALQITAKRLQQDSTLSLETPDPIPKGQWVKRGGQHGKADARALTGAELAARDLKRRETQKRREVEKRKTLGHEDEEDIESLSEEMPPASTAPPRLGGDGSRSKRRRAETTRMSEAKAAGWL